MVVIVELVSVGACGSQLFAYSAVRVVPACPVGAGPFRGGSAVCADRYGGVRAVAGYARLGPVVAFGWCT